MDAGVFETTDYYFNQALKLVVYGYSQIKKEKSKKPYSRKEIHRTIKEVQGSDNAYFQLEDFLRNDIVNNYLKKIRHKFMLTNFSIQPGSEESKQDVRTGIVDIRFENISASTLDGTGFIFECKRLNKYAGYQKAYIEEGMMRFVKRRYYPETGTTLAGMIAFVEVDIVRHKDGFEPVDKVAVRLRERIDLNKDLLRTTDTLSFYRLEDVKYPEISSFKYSYLTKHNRIGSNVGITIHHLLLDYYDILTS